MLETNFRMQEKAEEKFSCKQKNDYPQREISNEQTYSYLLSRVMLSLASAALREDSAGFKSLFNGKDLSGWDGNPKFWS